MRSLDQDWHFLYDKAFQPLSQAHDLSCVKKVLTELLFCTSQKLVVTEHPLNPPFSSKSSSKLRPIYSYVESSLVAVHGLDGHAFDTWTHKQSQVMWLRDLLPQNLPNIRIMTYGYNAKFKNFTGQQDLREISAKLLTELADLRKTAEEKARPIIFVCHSLGGIVTKKALLIQGPTEYQQIQAAVYGVIFLATPHNGSSLANIGKIVANIVSACSSMNPAKLLLGTLKKDSKALFEITQEFVHKTPKLRLVSFYEMEMTNLWIFRRMVVEQRSAVLNLPNEVPIGQNADHRNIARFESPTDRNYRSVSSRLQRFYDDITKKEIDSSFRQVTVDVAQSGHTTSIFEIPVSLTRIFYGRDSLLRQIADFFATSYSPKQQRSFAICGLGGSGKTQAAIQFARNYRSWYRSAVILFNATSVATLIADFERINDLLKLGNGSNKVDAVKSWLSTEPNSDWLLIFDNADTFNEVDITKFIPSTSWGHIIITSRDDAAIGSVSLTGSVIGNLTIEEAVHVLMARSLAAMVTPQDMLNAEAIVKQLGCLPLAVDQAGAYIRARQKTLAEYLRLLKHKQEDLLEWRPRVGDYDKTVLTTWELNFQQVELESEAAKRLLLLCCFLDPADISELLLLRGCSAQPRWSAEGEKFDLQPDESLRDKVLIETIRDEIAFDAAVEKLLTFSLLRRNNDINGARSFSVHPLVQFAAATRLEVQEQDTWRLQAILLVSHAFPHGEGLEPNYMVMGRPLIPHVRRVLNELDVYCKRNTLKKPVKHAVIELLVAASVFSNTPWKREIINRAKELLEDDDNQCYLALVAQRESTLLRMYGDPEGSNQALELFVQTAMMTENWPHAISPMWNARRGGLLLSYARNLTFDGQTSKATLELQSWKPINSGKPSTMERMQIFRRDTALARILREQGMFDQALHCQQKVLDQNQDEDHLYGNEGWRRGICASIADLHCELGQFKEAEEAVRHEIEHLTIRERLNISNGRLMQLSLAESYILRGMWSAAEELLQYLEGIFTVMVDPDLIARTGLFRVRYAFARISHMQGRWREAYRYWQMALSVGQSCKWKDYPLNIVWVSLADVCRELKDLDESYEFEKRGRESLARYEMKYWIVGIGTYWLEYINHRMARRLSTVMKGANSGNEARLSKH